MKRLLTIVAAIASLISVSAQEVYKTKNPQDIDSKIGYNPDQDITFSYIKDELGFGTLHGDQILETKQSLSVDANKSNVPRSLTQGAEKKETDQIKVYSKVTYDNGKPLQMESKLSWSKYTYQANAQFLPSSRYTPYNNKYLNEFSISVDYSDGCKKKIKQVYRNDELLAIGRDVIEFEASLKGGKDELDYECKGNVNKKGAFYIVTYPKKGLTVLVDRYGKNIVCPSDMVEAFFSFNSVVELADSGYYLAQNNEIRCSTIEEDVFKTTSVTDMPSFASNAFDRMERLTTGDYDSDLIKFDSGKDSGLIPSRNIYTYNCYTGLIIGTNLNTRESHYVKRMKLRYMTEEQYQKFRDEVKFNGAIGRRGIMNPQGEFICIPKSYDNPTPDDGFNEFYLNFKKEYKKQIAPNEPKKKKNRWYAEPYILDEDLCADPDEEPDLDPNFVKEFVKQNMQYPQNAKEKGIYGSVSVLYTIERDGSISNVKVLKGPEELRDEAVRLIKSLPKVKPAKNNGLPVRVKTSDTVRFYF